ncbi:hypothetical protein U1Q18_020218 [Sarracenia purpurea var. burkii]
MSKQNKTKHIHLLQCNPIGDGSHQDSTLAAMLMRPGPIKALVSARFTDGGDADKVPRVYAGAAGSDDQEVATGGGVCSGERSQSVLFLAVFSLQIACQGGGFGCC